MNKFPTLFNWIYKKYTRNNEVTLKFKISVLFPEPVNFLVQFPTGEKNWLIKEYTQQEWSKELELANCKNVYIKVFLTSTNLLKERQVKLEIVHFENEGSEKSIDKYFQIGTNLGLNEWMILKWEGEDI